MSTPSHIARYTVVQPIASGGMGEVFLARDERLDRLVAIKLLREGFDSEDLRRRFEEEARNVARLTHPNIVTIYEYGTHENRPYIAMEYIPGHSLAEVIRRQLPLRLARRVRIIEEVCSGLAHAHKAHLVHRDVKPANLMVTTSGMVKVLDFGIAKMRGTDRTQRGMIVGTVNYMSPEQVTGQPVDHRSDVFAVGSVLQEILTFDQAFKGDLTAAMFSIVHGQPEPLAVRCPGIDPAFQAIVDQCLAKDPAQRYQDLGLLKRDLSKLRRSLEDDDVEPGDTLVPFDIEQTVIGPVPGSDGAARVAGPDTRRALGAALAAGEAAIAGGLFDSALRYAEQALALESMNVSARDLMARATAARERAQLESKVNLAKAALHDDRLDDARAALDQAQALAKESDTVRGLLGAVAARAHDLERLTRTIALAREQITAGNLDAAGELARTAGVIRPQDAEVQRLVGDIERADQAMAAWQTGELAAVERLVAAADYDGALQRLAAARTRAPHARALERRMVEVTAAREAVARDEEARRREEEARRQDALARERAARERAERIETLARSAARTDQPAAARRRDLVELAKLEPAHADLPRLNAEVDAALAAAHRQQVLDEALAAAEALLAERKFDAAAAKLADVVKARPEDARAARLTTAIAEARRRQEALAATLAQADGLLQRQRFADALAALGRADQAHPDVVASTARVRRAQATAQRRQQLDALTAMGRSVATNRGAQAGLGVAAIVALAVLLWPASSPEPTVAPAIAPAPSNPADDQQSGPQDPRPTKGDPPQGKRTGGGAEVVVPPEPTPPAPRDTDDRPRPGGIVQAARLIVPVDPIYPEAARAARVEGVVTLEVQVTADGRVRQARTVKSVPGLDQAAIEAVRQYRYAAATRDGVPMPATMTVDVPFQLPPRPVLNNDPPVVPKGREAEPEPEPKPTVDPPPKPIVPDVGAMTRADKLVLEGLVARFGQAFQNRSVAELRGVWPSMPRSLENSYSGTFASNREIRWQLQNVDVHITGDDAEATANAMVEMRDIRRNVATTVGRTYRFTFARRAAGWAIVGVQNQR